MAAEVVVVVGEDGGAKWRGDGGGDVEAAGVMMWSGSMMGCGGEWGELAEGHRESHRKNVDGDRKVESGRNRKICGQIKGLLPIEGQKGQFKGSSTRWQRQTSFTSSHWLRPKKECHIGLKEAQRKWQFTLVTLSKEAQAVSITDCQAGNPCEIRCDPTVESEY
ncbi:hypothetical protein Tco_0938670 [Tanacetum coccineum]|uniref:Uncharacterized protein n=1 Tax=Tanacetum coccineum TaxID=301880 RepID=A0ABQ5DHU8_9ASTR